MDLYEKLGIPEDKEMFPTSMSFNYKLLVEEENWSMIAHSLKNLLDSWYEHGLLAVKPSGVESYIKHSPNKNVCVDMLFEPTEYMQECTDKLQKKWHNK